MIKSNDTIFICQYLLTLPLFQGANQDTLFDCLTTGTCKVLSYERSNVILSPAKTDRSLLFVLDGSASVYSSDESRSVMLRTLKKGDMVGVANIFNDESGISRIIATSKIIVLVMPKDDLSFLLEHDKKIMYNYITFLSDRICYLNKKIVCLTAGSAERRFAFYLDSLGDEDTVSLPLPMNAIADMLNIARASLYRAADRLTSDGFISRNGKKITLCNRKEMLNFYN